MSFKITRLAVILLLLCAVPILAAPSINSTSAITPESAENNATVSVTIAGTDFDPNATVQLNGSDNVTIPGTEVTVDGTATITCNFDLSGQPAGSYDVVVTNPNNETATLKGGFTVEETATESSEEAAVEATDETEETSEDAVEATDETEETSEDAVEATDETEETSEDAVEATDETEETSEDAVEATDETEETSEDAVEATDETEETSEDAVLL